MAVVFVAGTTAEFIKVAPVMTELDERDVAYELWSTAQHVDGVKETLGDLGIRTPDRLLVPEGTAKTVAKMAQVPGWFARVISTSAREFPELRRRIGRGVVVVHGDTFTTVLGSVLGRLAGADVAHVEAGMRSGSVRSPFPEELNRRVVGHLATINFPPTERERENLAYREQKGRAKSIVTGTNTVVDALRRVKEQLPSAPELPDEFGLVTLHRFELVQSKTEFGAILRKLKDFSQTLPVVMVIGHSERVRLREYGLESLFDDRLIAVDKRRYSAFLAILMRARMVVTDSGGLQQECAMLGLPCAVHRARTESFQGLGDNVILTELDMNVLDEFLENWRSYVRPSQLDHFHPSRIVADEIERFAAKGEQ